MRKWQRDRMKRRKEKPAGPSQPEQPQPEPLQPAYPDMDRSLQMSNREPEAAPEPQPEPAPAPESTPVEAGEYQRPARGGQRRRSRGGRGRRRSAAPPKPPLAAPTPLAAPAPPEAQEAAPSEVAQPELPATAPLERRPPQPAHRQPRQPKGAVVLAVGLPGSGKSSWFKRRGVTPLSSDLLRKLLFDDTTEQRYQDLVFGTLRSLLRARMVARMPWNYVDATNLSPRERHGWIKMAREFGYDVHAVFFDVPLEVCMERNLRRQRVVPEDVMQRMAAKLRPPTFEEGFAKIIVVRVKKKEQAPEQLGEP
jgi:predicted kinase